MDIVKHPEVSAVCPSYNSASFFGLTIISLIEQTLKNLEIIIVDDASTDSTPQLMEWFCKKDKRIRYIRNKKRKGAAYCRNLGIRLAKAKYIMSCDAGDLSFKNRAKIQYNYLKKHPLIDCYYSSVIEIDAMEKPAWDISAKPYNGDWGEKPPIAHTTVMYKRSVALELPYSEGCLETDRFEDLFCRWGQAGKKFAFTLDFLVQKLLTPHRYSRNLRVSWPEKYKIYQKFGIPIPEGLEKFMKEKRARIR